MTLEDRARDKVDALLEAVGWTLQDKDKLNHTSALGVYESCVNSIIGSLQIKKITWGVAQQKVSLARFRQLAFPLPPNNELIEIVFRLKEALSKIDGAEATLEIEAIRAKPLKQAVLKIAFEGKLVPQHAGEVPASELLKKIKENL